MIYNLFIICYCNVATGRLTGGLTVDLADCGFDWGTSLNPTPVQQEGVVVAEVVEEGASLQPRPHWGASSATNW